MNDKYTKLVEILPKESEELWFEYNLEVNKIIQENQQLKDKITLRNKEKTDICNKINNQREKNKRHKREITNLIAKNQQLKIQISAREEEYEKLEILVECLKLGVTLNQEQEELLDKILFERGVSDVED